MPKNRKQLFDDIYVNKINVNYGNLYKNTFADLKESLKEELPPLEDTQFEDIVEQSRSNPDFKLSKEQAELLKNKITSLRQEVPVVEQELREFREDIDSYIRSKKDAFSLNIRNKNALEAAALEVFREEKTSISYEDYTVLLEMKKLLDIDETFDLLTEDL